MAFIDALPPDATASMQRDIVAGRPSELEAQNGAVLRLGLEMGVATPLHTFVYHALLPQEQRACGRTAFE
jgi:2-dehydropantoate 2-reductase